jgi:hypothetical protein
LRGECPQRSSLITIAFETGVFDFAASLRPRALGPRL